MFEKRLIYFFEPAPGAEAPGEAQEQPGAEAARKKMADIMPPKGTELADSKRVETDFKATSVDEEAKRTDEGARADIIAFAKEGKKMDPNKPINGIDKDTYKQIVTGLNQVPHSGPDDHFSTITGVNVEIDGKTFYFSSVFDASKNKIQYFYREGNDFDPAQREKLADVDDATYKKLTGQERKKA